MDYGDKLPPSPWDNFTPPRRYIISPPLTVVNVDPEAGELTARFEGGDLLYGFGELDALVPAYAATVHKSQGSEYPAVVIPVRTQHYAMLKRNLLYTGVTRGKRLVVLVGQKKAVAIAVRNASGRRRWSKLDEWLAGAKADTGIEFAPDARSLRGAAVDRRNAVRVIEVRDLAMGMVNE